MLFPGQLKLAADTGDASAFDGRGKVLTEALINVIRPLTNYNYYRFGACYC